MVYWIICNWRSLYNQWILLQPPPLYHFLVVIGTLFSQDIRHLHFSTRKIHIRDINLFRSSNWLTACNNNIIIIVVFQVLFVNDRQILTTMLKTFCLPYSSFLPSYKLTKGQRNEKLLTNITWFFYVIFPLARELTSSK